jgi:asparaginyl-tRNA synthetase
MLLASTPFRLSCKLNFFWLCRVTKTTFTCTTTMTMTPVLVDDAILHIGKRAMVQGWVHRTATLGKALRFIILRDGKSSKYLQIVLTGPLARSKDAIELHREASVRVWGTFKEDGRASGGSGREPRDGVEMLADTWEVIGPSAEDIECVLRPDSGPEVRADQRHLVHRGTRASAILKGRSVMLRALRDYFYTMQCTEVTPPSIVQSQAEGGSDLFALDFFGTPAFLTQSSQLYLESILPALGDVFCIAPSFRAEQSQTRRHLAEYTHCEAEFSFVDDLDTLLGRIEDLVISTIQGAGAESVVKIPKKPFMRLTYAQAIAYCIEHDILSEKTGLPFVYGEDISEKPERAMTDRIGEPVFMTHFPASMKPFYMRLDPKDKTLTLSADLLYPGVGEIVGGSLREHDHTKLCARMASHGLGEAEYYWYMDQRKYGSVPHGGFGLGVERLCMAVLGIDHIRDACLYPRSMGHCKP